MEVTLIARPQLISIPERAGTPRSDQMLGPDGQRLSELAGRICYDSLGKGRASDQYAEHILEVGHGSVLEHAMYSFLISGVSRGLTHELIRHRVGVAISQRSTRYVDEAESPWVDHPLVDAYLEASDDTELKAAIQAAKDAGRKAYRETVKALEIWLNAQQVDKATARKQARGAARGYLGNALETELVWSANIRALLHVIKERGSIHADAEIRELAVKLAQIMKIELPAYFGHIELEESTDGLGAMTTNVKQV